MEYEYRDVHVPAHADREHTRELLGIHAEYGDWELLRHALFPGGKRLVTVRRKVRKDALPPLPS